MENEMKKDVKMENRALHNMKKQQLLNLIRDLNNGIQKQHDEAKKLVTEMQEQHDKASNLSNETKKKYDKAEKLTTEIQEQHDKASNLLNETQKQYDEAKKLTTGIKEQYDKASNLSDEIEQQHDKAKNLTVEIQEQHDKTSNLSDKAQIQCDNASKIIEEKSKKLEELIEQINRLLPGATSAGLASSYHDAWKEKNTIYYWIGFVLSLVILVAGYFYYLIYQPQEMNWLHIATRTIVGAPLIWIAWYCQKSISQTNRIKEEYHHKQRIMSVFEGFSKQIDELTKDDSRQNKVKKLDLISVIISAIRKNPSEILDPSETFLDSLKTNVRKSNQNQEEANETSVEEN